ncbi:hypothetical protein COV88_02470 [Candidatus Saccharibacteria bacterium CG11_big_fil_rev_8_21_14_0_20_41_19]|nr:lamin tail domain-containing protein [Candidatus Saccharibacteria bacterium]OIP86050.1 MAG: hypothetical protein AUK57_01925 [Candidatus Saccharibacteria bacterium CG2_30_41_52]PIQ70759.1 MAG: hypothetical protein COV88_02470 [Candidatus Saccharibacteria bacterium CG11_big_fil_rev_8_21_14_0_20_41_19]PIZ59257.1 MAG: hypothetical protein COY18_03975 [Candidatus Saccharibacteria bacterium CG_4_10_14_0_2_um_filter_41_11]PJC30030.1 MAG: hypothetical protein CO052_00205 [Candidatus Saccharibacteri
MHKLYVFTVFLSFLFAVFFNIQPSYAVGENIVFSQIQTRSIVGGKASEELIEIYNNSDVDVDVTNWSVTYGATGALDPLTGNLVPTKTLVHFEHSVPVVGNFVVIPKRSSILLVSKAFADSDPKFEYDYIFSSGISDNGRWLSLADDDGLAIDTVEWGTDGISVTAEGGQAALAPTENQLIQRKMIAPGDLQDTNNNFNDFELASSRSIYNPGSIYEMEDICLNIADIQSVIPDGYVADDVRNCSQPPVDICLNLDSLQTELPDGYEVDVNGDCIQIIIDVCGNLEGIQQALPDNMGFDATGDCIVIDRCSNLPEIQTVISDDFEVGPNDTCLLGLLPLQITELLPNAVGSDDGSEFIEIYNPNDKDVNLSYYFIYIGADDEHFYSFPASSYIKAKGYKSFSNADIKFTLVNSTSNVRLRAIDDSLIDRSDVYSNPDDGMAWAKINDIWQYTNRPTPGSENLVSFIEVEKVIVVPAKSSLQPCAANQYRSTETNRCRLIVVATNSVLTPCRNGQYRSEETNRCRNIASDVNALTPCAEGQERNPETNRCRSIMAVLGASDLAPCKAGQERNPETNRCRNVISSVPAAAYAPEQTFEASNNYVLLWSLVGVGAIAIIYGIWEWRQEIVKLVHRIGSFRHFNK